MMVFRSWRWVGVYLCTTSIIRTLGRGWYSLDKHKTRVQYNDEGLRDVKLNNDMSVCRNDTDSRLSSEVVEQDLVADGINSFGIFQLTMHLIMIRC